VGFALQSVVEVVAVGAFAYSGADVARRHGMDIVGLSALAIVNGLAGGMVRDVLIGRKVLAFHDTRLLPTCLIAAIVVTVFGAVMPSRIVDTFDAIGLGLFTVLGTTRALDAGVTEVAAVLLGAVTVGAGSVLRDLLAGDPPGLLYRSELYLIVSVLGGALYVAGTHTSLDRSVLLLGIATIVTLSRLAALWFKLHSPVPGQRRRQRETSASSHEEVKT
jgi:uncharacterized membrane protein YeiH